MHRGIGQQIKSPVEKMRWQRWFSGVLGPHLLTLWGTCDGEKNAGRIMWHRSTAPFLN